MHKENCPSGNELFAFLKNEEPAGMRDEMETHLAGCAKCRRMISMMYLESREDNDHIDPPLNLTETARSIPQTRSGAPDAGIPDFSGSRSSWIRAKKVQIVFASFVLVFAGIFGVYFLQRDPAAAPDDTFRNAPPSANGIHLVSPDNEEIVGEQGTRFEWKKIEGALRYTLIFSDEKGDIVGKFETEEPVVEGSVSKFGLVDRRKYFWHVTAKRPDGSRIESEFRTILIRK
ncbi:MAG: zf-HC2 domain-containing protein [Acidobacteria bacterium]|nr:zf-HC2 domain-containing protein [Acidobacteriota bacterium]